MRPARFPAAIVLVGLVLVGCSGAPDDPVDEPTSQAPSASEPTATSSATETEPEAEPEAGDGWSDETVARSAVADFAAELGDTERYRVDRRERTVIGGEYIEVNIAYVVDMAAERAMGTQTFAVSDEALWAEITPEGGDPEAAKSLQARTVFDFTADPPLSYLTYLGDNGWDGKWFVIDPSAVGETQEGAGAADLLSQVTVADFASAVVDLTADEPTGFATGALEYEVSGESAAAWIPTQTGSLLSGAGVDPFSLAATATASIRPIEGGVEAMLDLTPLLREASALVADQNIAGYLQNVSVPITFRIYDLGTDEPVELPAPETIVTEPPTT